MTDGPKHLRVSNYAGRVAAVSSAVEGRTGATQVGLERESRAQETRRGRQRLQAAPPKNMQFPELKKDSDTSTMVFGITQDNLGEIRAKKREKKSQKGQSPQPSSHEHMRPTVYKCHRFSLLGKRVGRATVPRLRGFFLLPRTTGQIANGMLRGYGPAAGRPQGRGCPVAGSGTCSVPHAKGKHRRPDAGGDGAGWGGMTSAPSSSLAFIKVKQTALTMETTKQMGRESTRTGFS